MHDFDLFVIGAGSGGVRAARTAAALGARVGIAEERQPGGTCVNVGCIPKKLYALAAHYRFDFEDSAGFGWQVPLPRFDWNILRENKRREILRLNGVYTSLLETAGVRLFPARAELLDAGTLRVGEQMVRARHILIATGGWPHVPELPGQELAHTSNGIFDLACFPRHILIVGAGYIAVEFAGIFAGLGAQTTLCYRGDMPLRGFDMDLRRRFAIEAGRHIKLCPDSEVALLERSEGEGQIRAGMKDGSSIEADVVLYATGRRPNTAGLGLERVGVSLNQDGTIAVDEGFQTSIPGIHAIGDVVGRMALTPVALAEGMVVANRLFGDGSKNLSYTNIPTAVFSHPNLATVGLSEEAAAVNHPVLAIYETDFRQLRHTLSGRQERCYLKIVVDQRSDRVLGMHMLGPDAGEVLQGFAAAMQCGLSKAALDATIGIHPTLAEEFVTLRTPSRVVQA